jgi:hypothetical protein
MEETMKCACGGEIQDGVCVDCGTPVADSTTGEMGSNIESSDDVATEETSGEEATA